MIALHVDILLLINYLATRRRSVGWLLGTYSTGLAKRHGPNRNDTALLLPAGVSLDKEIIKSGDYLHACTAAIYLSNTEYSTLV